MFETVYHVLTNQYKVVYSFTTTVFIKNVETAKNTYRTTY